MRVPWMLLLLASSLPASAENPVDRFTARFGTGLDFVEVRACFTGAAPRRLYRNRQAGIHSQGPSFRGRLLETEDRGTSLALPALPDDACLDWRVDLAAATASQEARLAFRLGEDIVLSTDLWLWKGPWQRALEVRVELPPGRHFSSPWQATGEQLYRPAMTPAAWSSRTAVGRRPPRSMAAPGAEIQVMVVGDVSREDTDKLAAWLERPVASVASVFGNFPQPRLQILVAGIGPRSEPVPWAHVMRGGGDAVELFVDHTRTPGELDADWTATHELAHLLLPYVTRRDRWLSEGLASYYQNVLRARDGRLTVLQAWQKLHNGFRRGAEGARGGTLAEAASAGSEQTMRVYWSGAAIMLTADARLRQRTAGEQSLDTVLGSLNTCCRDSGRTWLARDLLKELDRLSGTDVFSSVYREYVNSGSFPDLSEIYRDLGLKTRFGRVRTVDNAPLEEVREQIMAVAPG